MLGHRPRRRRVDQRPRLGRAARPVRRRQGRVRGEQPDPGRPGRGGRHLHPPRRPVRDDLPTANGGAGRGDRDRRVDGRPAGDRALVADPGLPGRSDRRRPRAGPGRRVVVRGGGRLVLAGLDREGHQDPAARRGLVQHRRRRPVAVVPVRGRRPLRPRRAAGPGRPRHRQPGTRRTGVGGHPGPGRRGRRQVPRQRVGRRRQGPGRPGPVLGAAPVRPPTGRELRPGRVPGRPRAPCTCSPRPTTPRPGCCSAWSPTSPAPRRTWPTTHPGPGWIRR